MDEEMHPSLFVMTKEERNKRRSDRGYAHRLAVYNSFRYAAYHIFKDAREKMFMHGDILSLLNIDVYKHPLFKKMNESYKSQIHGYIEAMFDLIDREYVTFAYTLSNGEIVFSGSNKIKKHYKEINKQEPSSGRSVWKQDYKKDYTVNKYEREKKASNYSRDSQGQRSNHYKKETEQ